MFALFRIAFVPALLISAPALAGDPAPAPQAAPATTAAAAKSDPVICQQIKEVGSLLHVKKVCMTKSEWDEQRRSDRAGINRIQVQRGISSGG